MTQEAFIGNALMDMYVKCGELCKARDLLDELPVQDVVTWNSLVSGCAQQGHDKEAMESFEEMQQRGILPDGVTFIGIIKICGNIGSLRRGKEIHAKIIKEDMDFTTGNALVDMYAKCGAPREAQEVFEELPDHDESSWTSLMAAYSQLQEDAMVVSLFNRMLQERIHPDSLTFTVVLTACSHAGLVDQGKEYFASMAAKVGIIPTVEHHTCMIDLFGRAGHFDEVVEAIARMPMMLDYLPMWSSLLGSCQKWGNVELGELAFENCFRLSEDHASGCVSMRNIYMQSYKEMHLST
jgi:pentatricopeptide repeat protein